MRQLYEDYKDKGLGIVGISLDDNSEAWVKAINDLKIEWPQVSDLKGWEAAPAQLFSVSAIPFIVVLDQEGTIINKNVRGEKLQQFIEHCLQ